MKTNLPNVFFIIGFLFSLGSCDNMFLGEEEPSDPINNFDLLWNDIDDMYGLFVVKNINWDSLYYVYRPMIDEHSTDDELYNAITGLLDHLNDNHVALSPTNSTLERYNSGILGTLKTFTDFKLSVVQNNYLTESKEYSNTLHYGKIKDAIGYIHLSEITEGIRFYEKAFDNILDYLKNTDGIIIDVRNNPGGIDKESVYIAGRFTDESKTAFKFRLKNGPGHDNFTPFYEYIVNGVYPWARPKTLKRILPCAKSTGCSIPTSFAVGINSTYNFHIMIFMKIESH